MLQKALTLGMVFIFALSLLAVSMITCFSYDAEAMMGPDVNGVIDLDAGHGHFTCTDGVDTFTMLHATMAGFACTWGTQ